MNYPRMEHMMSEEDLSRLLDECSAPERVMFLSGGTSLGVSRQERANNAWAKLGKKMGFDSMTVRPIEGKGMRFFTAIPSETEAQHQERVEQEKAEARERRAAELRVVIDKAQKELDSLATMEKTEKRDD